MGSSGVIRLERPELIEAVEDRYSILIHYQIMTAGDSNIGKSSI